MRLTCPEKLAAMIDHTFLKPDGTQEDIILELKSGNYRYVKDEIRRVVQAAGCPVKVISETCYLTTKEEKIKER